MFQQADGGGCQVIVCISDDPADSEREACIRAAREEAEAEGLVPIEFRFIPPAGAVERDLVGRPGGGTIRDLLDLMERRAAVAGSMVAFIGAPISDEARNMIAAIDSLPAAEGRLALCAAATRAQASTTSNCQSLLTRRLSEARRCHEVLDNVRASLAASREAARVSPLIMVGTNIGRPTGSTTCGRWTAPAGRVIQQCFARLGSVNDEGGNGRATIEKISSSEVRWSATHPHTCKHRADVAAQCAPRHAVRSAEGASFGVAAAACPHHMTVTRPRPAS